MTTYTGLTTISGIYLDGRDQLNLVGGVLARNPEAKPWWDSPGNHLTEVVPEGQTELNLRKIARWVLACEIEASRPTLGRVKDYLEKIALPLRLGTPANVVLGGIKLATGALADVLAAGLQQPAPVIYGVNTVIRLDANECEEMEKALAQLAYRPRFAVPLVHYINASNEPGSPQAGLKCLLALEAMFDPDGKQRSKEQRVSEKASTFAATSSNQKREMKKVLLQAYTHRGALQHGETRLELLQSANIWFKENEAKLRLIVAWSTQRVLRLTAEHSEIDPATLINSIPATHRKQAVAMVMALPLNWAAMGKEFAALNPMMWEASGGSIEYPASGGVTIKFPGAEG